MCSCWTRYRSCGIAKRKKTFLSPCKNRKNVGCFFFDGIFLPSRKRPLYPSSTIMVGIFVRVRIDLVTNSSIFELFELLIVKELEGQKI